MVLFLRLALAFVVVLLTSCGASDGQPAADVPAGHLAPPAEALPTSPAGAAADGDAAQAERSRELGDAGGTPFRQLELTSLSPRRVDAAPVTDVSGDVRFTVDATVAVERKGTAGSPEPQRPVLVVTGRLQNTAATERTVHLFPVGRFGMGGAADTPFVATLAASDAIVDASPALPPEPPQTVAVTLPPRSEVPFRTYVDTLHLRYQGAPRAKLEWTFYFSSSDRNPRGTLSVQLPPGP